MSLVTYPTLDLLIYQRRNSSGDEDTQVKQNQAKFLENFPPEIKYQPQFELENKADSLDFLMLLKQETLPERKVGNYPICEAFLAALIKDTYGLYYSKWIEIKDQPVSTDSIKTLKEAGDRCFSGDIGKTWLISGANTTNANTTELAQEMYQVAFPESQQKPVAKGKFLEADVFVVATLPMTEIEKENYVVFIFIFPDLESMDKLGKFSKQFLLLFCFLNKMIWAYQQTRTAKKELLKVYNYVQTTLDKIKQIVNDKDVKPHSPETQALTTMRHNQTNAPIAKILTSQNLASLQVILKNNLAECFDYSKTLNDLDIYEQVIEINLHNYQELLKVMLQVNRNLELGDNLQWLNQFTDLVKEKYLPQLRKDRASLSPGLRLLENLINTIRGIIEVDQAERDRRLTNTIAIASLGIGVASASGSAFANFIGTIRHPEKAGQSIDAIVNGISVLGISVSFGLISIGLWCIGRYFLNKRR